MTYEEAIRVLYSIDNADEMDEEFAEAYNMAIKALEQEPKSEWEQDHAILKAYSDGANEVLDKIRAEIEKLRLHKAQFLTSDNRVCIDSQEVLDVIDKYRQEN